MFKITVIDGLKSVDTIMVTPEELSAKKSELLKGAHAHFRLVIEEVREYEYVEDECEGGTCPKKIRLKKPKKAEKKDKDAEKPKKKIKKQKLKKPNKIRLVC